MIVRHTTEEDLDEVMSIYDSARKRMRHGGNFAQWVNGYPSRGLIMSDIAEGNSYVVESENGIAGTFTFVIGDDPTYAEIDGEWLNSKPYGTIHRIASGDGTSGVADTCLEYCKSKGVDIRIDTHSENSPMLNWISTRGFTYCGIIYVSDGTPRKAFQLNCQVLSEIL